MVAVATTQGTIDPNIIAPAVITGFVSLVAAYLAYLVSKRPSKEGSKESSSHVETSPLANFSGTSNDFIKIVISENEKKQAQIDKLAEKQQETDDKLDHVMRSHSNFEDAVSRYIKRIAEHVEKLGGTMPRPDTSDIPILGRILPRSPRR